MLFDLISDFHVEMNVGWNTTSLYKKGDPLHFAWHRARNEGSDILVVAGDTANSHDFTRDVIAEAARYYEHVIFTDGNHDHYTNFRNKMTVMRDMEWFNQQFTHRNRVAENVTYLDRHNTYKVGRTLFIGANGWYNFLYSKGAVRQAQYRAWKHGSNDPVCIRNTGTVRTAGTKYAADECAIQ